MPNSKLPKFPHDASIEKKMEYYHRDVIVNHPMLDNALDHLDQRAYPLLDRRIILLIGGTGVGKSALMRRLCERRISNKFDVVSKNPQIVPAIYIEVQAPDKGKFEFSTLYRSALLQTNSALIDRTLPLVGRQSGMQTVSTIGVEHARRSVDELALKDRFTRTLIDREIEVMCLDESVNLFKVGSARSDRVRREQLKDQTDKLKTFVNTTSTSLILAGAYDFFELTLTSGQIARRSLIVHLEPYTMSKESLQGFVKALIALISHLPIEHSLDPSQIATELFLQCLGCVGTLKNILLDALLLALKEDKPLTMSFVRKAYYSASQLDVMRIEMESGMKRVRELLTPLEMADTAEQTVLSTSSIPKTYKKPLGVGETTPSHRHDATESWFK
ncbi:MAG: AAA family ATPase [Burkholderiaceae bacterium]